MTIRYVNAYIAARAYGGPEEGGWWYDQLYPLATIPVATDAQERTAVGLLEEVSPKFSFGKIGSVLGGQEVRIVIEAQSARPQPEETPRYE